MFLLPSLAGVLVFFLFPLCYCVVFSFSRSFGSFSFHGIKNYLSLMQSQAFVLAYGNTFVLLILYFLVLLALSGAVVYVFGASKRILFFLTVASISMFFPSGVIVNFIKEFPFLYETCPKLGFLLMFIWKQWGINCLILESALSYMDASWMEAAAIDGASKRYAFFHITLPFLLPHMKFLFVFDIICFFRMFRESYLLYGLYPPDGIYLIQNFLFNNFQNLNYQRLSTGTILTIGLLLLLNALVFRVGSREEG